MNKLVSLFLFVIFSAIGLAAILTAVMAPEIKVYYHNRISVNNAKKSLDKLSSINEDYDVLIDKLHNDPNFAKKAIPAVLGVHPNHPNTAYPKAQNRQLKAAVESLYENTDPNGDSKIPAWLKRCSKPKIRWTLFFCGAGLVIISLMSFFGHGESSEI
jgi:hypothetical protein